MGSIKASEGGAAGGGSGGSGRQKPRSGKSRGHHSKIKFKSKGASSVSVGCGSSSGGDNTLPRIVEEDEEECMMLMSEHSALSISSSSRGTARSGPDVPNDAASAVSSASGATSVQVTTLAPRLVTAVEHDRASEHDDMEAAEAAGTSAFGVGGTKRLSLFSWPPPRNVVIRDLEPPQLGLIVGRAGRESIVSSVSGETMANIDTTNDPQFVAESEAHPAAPTAPGSVVSAATSSAAAATVVATNVGTASVAGSNPPSVRSGPSSENATATMNSSRKSGTLGSSKASSATATGERRGSRFVDNNMSPLPPGTITKGILKTKSSKATSTLKATFANDVKKGSIRIEDDTDDEFLRSDKSTDALVEPRPSLHVQWTENRFRYFPPPAGFLRSSMIHPKGMPFSKSFNTDLHKAGFDMNGYLEERWRKNLRLRKRRIQLCIAFFVALIVFLVVLTASLITIRARGKSDNGNGGGSKTNVTLPADGTNPGAQDMVYITLEPTYDSDSIYAGHMHTFNATTNAGSFDGGSTIPLQNNGPSKDKRQEQAAAVEDHFSWIQYALIPTTEKIVLVRSSISGSDGSKEMAEIFSVDHGARTTRRVSTDLTTYHAAVALPEGQILFQGKNPSIALKENNNYGFQWKHGNANVSLLILQSPSAAIPLPDGKVLFVGVSSEKNERSYEVIPKTSIPEAVLSDWIPAQASPKGTPLSIILKSISRAVGGPQNKGRARLIATSKPPPLVQVLSEGGVFYQEFNENSERIYLNTDGQKTKTSQDLQRRADAIPAGSGDASRAFGALLPLDPADGYSSLVLVCSNRTEEVAGISGCAIAQTSEVTPNTVNVIHNVPLGTPVTYGTSILLPDGTALSIGQTHDGESTTSSFNVFVPSNTGRQKGSDIGSWVPVGSSVSKLLPTSAILQPDGRVLIAGTDPTISGSESSETVSTRFVMFSPHYMATTQRPSIAYLDSQRWGYGEIRQVMVSIPKGMLSELSAPIPSPSSSNITVIPGRTTEGTSRLEFSLVNPGSASSISGSNNGQRMIWLSVKGSRTGSEDASISIIAPPSANVAPPQQYLLFAVLNGVPSHGIWVQVGGDPSNVSALL
ncbi:hypothetical protein HDU97_000952 [Phlyctochytrium planicorne]|nr:hypothetical protein HDU97_000952 [Phlyctochytrium planicorne]